MNDLTPNDLSFLSDKEFQALCPQGEHAPGPEPLSPAAQAVMDAAAETMKCSDGFLPYEQDILAAALRAAASQLTSAKAADQLRAIADELDAQ